MDDDDDKPVAKCATCKGALYKDQVVIEGNLTHKLTDKGMVTSRTFYCCQECADGEG